VVLTPQDETLPWRIPASVLLHVALVGMLAVIPAPKRLKRPQEEPVSVDILTPQQFDAMREAAPHEAEAPAATIPPAARRAPEAPPVAAAPAMIRPTEMLSAKTLADPRSKQARADLATFASDERMVQLCNLEAMDQIRKWRADFLPERVVPYATAEEKISGTTISADGAAFRSKRNWYGLKFKCDLAPDGESVTGFAFLVGDPVARSKWEELGRPAVH